MILSYDTPIQKHLDLGESLLWVGRPPQGLLLRATDWSVIPFSLVWASLALTWTSIALGLRGRGGFNPCASTVAIPFVVAAFYITIGRFFHDAWERRRTWYALTDRRALILIIGQKSNLYGVPLADLISAKRLDHNDRTATITFTPRKPDPQFTQIRNDFRGTGRPTDFCFEHIENAGELFDLIERHRQTAPPADSGIPVSPTKA